MAELEPNLEVPMTPENKEPTPLAASDLEEPLFDADDFRNYPEAARLTRALNFILDNLGGIAFSGVVLAFIEAGSPGFIEGLGPIQERLYGSGIMLFYYLFFEGLFGWTPGKFATGTRVISMRDGQAATVKQVIGRSFARFVPFEPLSFLGQNGGWHDTWSDTAVIQYRGVRSPQQ